MAGGAYRDADQARGIGHRLGWDRTGPGQPGAVAEPAPQRTARSSAPPAHCWVIDLDGMPPRLPGLLLDWRREANGWRGLVAIAVPDTLVTVMWLPAEHLRPAAE